MTKKEKKVAPKAPESKPQQPAVQVQEQEQQAAPIKPKVTLEGFSEVKSKQKKSKKGSSAAASQETLTADETTY